jgi:hypothetical protein
MQHVWLLIGFAGSDVIERVSREFSPTAKITLKKTEAEESRVIPPSHRVECGAARYPAKKSTLSGGDAWHASLQHFGASGV